MPKLCQEKTPQNQIFGGDKVKQILTSGDETGILYLSGDG